jgi:nucleoid DNA-binding protein
VAKRKGDSFSFPKDANAQTKSGILNAVASATGIPRKQVGQVVAALGALAAVELVRRGNFTVPGVAKMKVVKKAATKARKGINPFTKEPMVFKAKPARKLVKIRPIKALKDAIS